MLSIIWVWSRSQSTIPPKEWKQSNQFKSRVSSPHIPTPLYMCVFPSNNSTAQHRLHISPPSHSAVLVPLVKFRQPCWAQSLLIGELLQLWTQPPHLLKGSEVSSSNGSEAKQVAGQTIPFQLWCKKKLANILIILNSCKSGGWVPRSTSQSL